MHSGVDSQQPSLSNIMGNPGNPSHMISDVVEDAEACLETARFSLRFGVRKVSLKLINTKTTEFSMCVTSPCQDDGVAWHSIGQQTE